MTGGRDDIPGRHAKARPRGSGGEPGAEVAGNQPTLRDPRRRVGWFWGDPRNVELRDSPSLFPVPPIDFGNAVVLTDTSYASWTAMFGNRENAGKLDYLLMPGDYRSWGRLEFVNRAGNTEGRPKTVRYHNSGVDDGLHPTRRRNSARIDSLRFDLPGTKNWLVQGLTILHPTASPSVTQGASNITVDRCLIQSARIYSFRIRHATNCTIQRCVIREAINGNENEGVGDSSGIQVGNIDANVLGIKILDNEIYNVGDGIQLTDGPTPRRPVEVLIEGNDLYLEPSRYLGDTNTTWDENAIDIKAGSDRSESTIIRNNRMWGFRRNAGPTALGEILVLQRYCRNVVVERNIMGDAPRGMKDENWPTGLGLAVDTPRNVVFRNNQFYEIRDYAESDRGAITKPITAGISFVHNYFARSDYLADIGPPNYRGSGPTYTGNTLVEVDAIQRQEDPTAPLPYDPAPLPYDPALNRVATAPHSYETYQRKRWTGPEFAMGAVPRRP
jgi:hypothetical protein